MNFDTALAAANAALAETGIGLRVEKRGQKLNRTIHQSIKQQSARSAGPHVDPLHPHFFLPMLSMICAFEMRGEWTKENLQLNMETYLTYLCNH